MGLENSMVVDAVGVDKDSGSVVLTVIDSWDWQDTPKHLAALQAKLNAYLEFVASGQIWESYPDARGRRVLIDVVGRYPLPTTASALLDQASRELVRLGVTVHCRTA